MPEDVNLATQGEEVVEQQLDSTNQGDAGQQQNNQQQEDYFLEADDRHKYRTREDAIRAITESGQRIGQLTPWQEHAQRYGLTDPNALPAIFDQYLEMKEKLARLEGQLQSNQAGPQQTATTQKLSQQDEANVQYLEKHGFSRKDAIDQTLKDRLTPLEQKIQQLESQLTQSEQSQTQQVIDAGRNHLGGLMSDAGLPIDNPQFNEMVENNIVAWMEAQSLDRNGNIVPGSVLDKFYQGGRAMQSVVEEGFKKVNEVINIVRIQNEGQTQRNRSQAVTRTAKPLPRQGAPVPSENNQQQPQRGRTPGAGGIFADPAVHDRAWEKMQESNRDR